MKIIYVFYAIGALLGIYIISLVFLVLSVGRYAEYWKRGLTQQTAQDALVYVTIVQQE